MALSNVHDVASHGTEHTNNATHIEQVTYAEKHFRPNPDAKPFIPNPFAVPAANWHFYANENGKSVNGFLPQFWLHPPVDPENLLATGNPTNSKKHIAFHLVSNVLDDEVPEETSTERPANFQLSSLINKEGNMYNNNGNNVIDAWHSLNSVSNFNLPLDNERSSSDKSSINNKSIHEIWSPDPSPNGLNNLSPSDDVTVSYNQIQQQLLDNSAVDSPDVSFEQLQNEMINQHGVQVYNDVEQESNDSNSQSQYCYQNLPSPVYQHPQFDYRNMTAQTAEMYAAAAMISPRMGNNVRPVVVEPRGYYQNPHYVNRYHMDNNQRRRYRNHEPVMQIAYEAKMSVLEELGIALDECRDQLRHLDRDYRKADLNLSQEFRLRKSSLGDGSPTKYPANSSRVDKLIVEQQREHQKVESLIGRIERLGFTPMHPNVGVTLDLWLSAIKDLRNVRKNEIANITDTHGLHRGHGGGKSHTQTDAFNLVSAVKELTKLTRSARTIVWCAMQILYANCSTGSSSGE